MTFLLQKFNAISRTRTEARARNGLRSPARGIAFTGRFAVCLLLAGFLGVGSAMAQVPTVLRVGGGAATVEIGDGQQVHHYLIDTDGDGDYSDENLSAVGTNPTGQGGTVVNTFLIGGIALVTWTDGNPSTLMVSPIAPGGFEITASRSGNADLDDTSNMGTPYEFVVLSAHAPMLTGISGAADAYNMGVQGDTAPAAELVPRDSPSKEYKDIHNWFSDPNDVFLTYTAMVDKVERCDGVTDPVCGEKKMVDVATATIDGNKLTIALNSNAKSDSSDTAVWVFAHDAAGEYARKQINVTTASPTNPYVMTALDDVIIRQDAAETTLGDLDAGLDDPEDISDGGAAGRVADNGDAIALEYAVTISDASAQKVDTGDGTFTLVAPYMIAKVTEGATASIAVTPRDVASIMVTVTATDKGKFCRDAGTDQTVNIVPEDVTATTTHDATGDTAPVQCQIIDTSVTPNDTTYTSLFPDSKSVKDVFMLSIISKTTPAADAAIGGKEIVADGDAVTFDLEEPKAFSDPTNGGLAYTLEPEDEIATITVDGSMVTIAPVWWAGGKDGTRSTDVKVTATNNLDEDSLPTSFTLTVKTATKPVVNPELAPFLGGLPPFNITVGSSLTFDLTDVTKGLEDLVPVIPDEVKGQPLLVDPNADKDDALPGGLLYKVGIDDVESPHRYDNLSRENHVVTSAGTVTLDPQAAMLTITGTAENYINVTVWGTDRERLMISAKMNFVIMGVTSAEGEELPTEVELSQNYPNPFNPQTSIDYALPQAGDVSLVVYDMLGREVDVLLDGPQVAGRHTVRFGANHLPNGAYVYRLVAGDKTITRTMVLVK